MTACKCHQALCAPLPVSASAGLQMAGVSPCRAARGRWGVEVNSALQMVAVKHRAPAQTGGLHALGLTRIEMSPVSPAVHDDRGQKNPNEINVSPAVPGVPGRNVVTLMKSPSGRASGRAWRWLNLLAVWRWHRVAGVGGYPVNGSSWRGRQHGAKRSRQRPSAQTLEKVNYER
jgi:hypothetical protein